MTTNDHSQHATLGSFIAAHRKAAGLSQRQLAKKTGLHNSFIARLENGENIARTPEHLQWIADALAVDVAELLHFVGVTPRLPAPRAYFRRKLGINAEEAEVLAQLVEDYQAQQRTRRMETEHETSND